MAEPSPPFDRSTYSPTTTYTILGKSYEEAYANVPGQHRALEWVISELITNRSSPSTSSPQAPPPRVLDIGSGTGKPTATLLSAAGIHVTGIDLTPKMVEVAKALDLPNATFELGDARTFSPFPSGDNINNKDHDLYDGVTSFFALLNGVTQPDIRSYLLRSSKWIKPGGIYVFGTVPMDMESEKLKWMGREEIISSLGAEEILKIIGGSEEEGGAGLEIVKWESAPFRNRGAELGLCREGDVWEEDQLFVCARRKAYWGGS